METLTHCSLCSAALDNTASRIQVGEWFIVACPACGVGITNPRPTLAEIGGYYRNSFFSVRPDAKLGPTLTDWLRGKIDRKALQATLRTILLSEIKFRHDQTLQGGAVRRMTLFPVRALLAACYEPVQAFPGKPGKVLDIGFGRGEFLLRAKRLGWECHGVEVSARSVEWGRELGFTAKQFDGSFQTALDYPDHSFDLVSANSVLEHVHHPQLLIAECRRLLKPGGMLFLMVPNFECRDKELLGEHWRMWSPPQHLFHFTAGNVRALLDGNGFSSPRVNYKVWFNPITEKLSLKSLRPTVSARAFRKASWHLRIGKRIAFLRGQLSAAEIGPGMAIEAVRD